MKRQKEVERNKRFLFLGVTAAGAATSVLLTPVLGIPLAGYGIYLGWDWIKFRAKNGMRF